MSSTGRYNRAIMLTIEGYSVKSKLKFCVLVGASLMTAPLFADHMTDEAIADRLKPAGQVCVQGKDCDRPTPVVEVAAAAPAGPRDGKTVVETKCGMCHTAGVAGAPKLNDAGDWAPRIAKGIDTLYKHAIEGFGAAMPAKGMCMDCSDDELKAAVDHMVEGAK